MARVSNPSFTIAIVNNCVTSYPFANPSSSPLSDTQNSKYPLELLSIDILSVVS